MATNKNTMLPTYEATYANMIRALADGTIGSPCWVFLTDREILVFVNYETVDGVKRLVPHAMLWNRIVDIEQQLSGLVDPVTGEPIKVTEYVDDKVEPVSEKVEAVAQDVEEVKEVVGNVIMLVSEEAES